MATLEYICNVLGMQAMYVGVCVSGSGCIRGYLTRKRMLNWGCGPQIEFTSITNKDHLEMFI